MSTITLTPNVGEIPTITKDPSDVKVYTFDWDTDNLAAAVTITTSTWTISAEWPSLTDVILTKDNESILAGSRKTQVRLLAGTVGQQYLLTNTIVTNESPAQTKERSIRILVVNQ